MFSDGAGRGLRHNPAPRARRRRPLAIGLAILSTACGQVSSGPEGRVPSKREPFGGTTSPKCTR
jgi:hypothetical protein